MARMEAKVSRVHAWNSSSGAAGYVLGEPARRWAHTSPQTENAEGGPGAYARLRFGREVGVHARLRFRRQVGMARKVVQPGGIEVGGGVVIPCCSAEEWFPADVAVFCEREDVLWEIGDVGRASRRSAMHSLEMQAEVEPSANAVFGT